MPRRALVAVLVLLALAAPATAHACSWGDPSRPLEDEARAYYDADVVFVAKVGKVEELPPEPDFPYAMWVAPYQVLEVYRGEPSTGALLASEDQMKPGLHGTPPHNCMGGRLVPGYQGERVLVFGNLQDRGGQPLYRMNLSSTHLDNCTGCEDILERLRLYARFHQVNTRPR
jgi:hypothetical protein